MKTNLLKLTIFVMACTVLLVSSAYLIEKGSSTPTYNLKTLYAVGYDWTSIEGRWSTGTFSSSTSLSKHVDIVNGDPSPSSIVVSVQFTLDKPATKLKYSMTSNMQVDVGSCGTTSGNPPTCGSASYSLQVKIYLNGVLIASLSDRQATVILNASKNDVVKIVFSQEIQVNGYVVGIDFTNTYNVQFEVVKKYELRHTATPSGTKIIHRLTGNVPTKSVLKLPPDLTFTKCLQGSCHALNSNTIELQGTVQIELESENLLKNASINPLRAFYLPGEKVKICGTDLTANLELYDSSGSIIKTSDNGELTLPNAQGEYTLTAVVKRDYRLGFKNFQIVISEIEAKIISPSQALINKPFHVKVYMFRKYDQKPLKGVKISLQEWKKETDKNGEAEFQITERTFGEKTYQILIEAQGYSRQLSFKVKVEAVKIQLELSKKPEPDGKIWLNNGEELKVKVKALWTNGSQAINAAIHFAGEEKKYTGNELLFTLSGENKHIKTLVYAEIDGYNVTLNPQTLDVIFTSIKLDLPSQIWLNVNEKLQLEVHATWTHSGENVNIRIKIGGIEAELPEKLDLGPFTAGTYSISLKPVNTPHNITSITPDHITIISTGIALKIEASRTLQMVGKEIEIKISGTWLHSGEPVAGAKISLNGISLTLNAEGQRTIKISRDEPETLELKPMLIEAPHNINYSTANSLKLTWTYIKLSTDKQKFVGYIGQPLHIKLYASWAHNNKPADVGEILIDEEKAGHISNGSALIQLSSEEIGVKKYSIKAVSQGISTLKPLELTVEWNGVLILTCSPEIWANNGQQVNITIESSLPEVLNLDGAVLKCEETGKTAPLKEKQTFTIKGENEEKTLTFYVVKNGKKVSNTLRIKVTFTLILIKIFPQSAWIDAWKPLTLQVKALFTHNLQEIRGVRVKIANKTLTSPGKIEVKLPPGEYIISAKLAEPFRGITAYNSSTATIVSTCVVLNADPSTLPTNTRSQITINAYWLHNGQPVKEATIEINGTKYTVRNGKAKLLLESPREASYEIKLISAPHGIKCYRTATIRFANLQALIKIINYTRIVRPGSLAEAHLKINWLNGTPIKKGKIRLDGLKQRWNITNGQATIRWREPKPGIYSRKIIIEGVVSNEPRVTIIVTEIKAKIQAIEISPSKIYAKISFYWLHNNSQAPAIGIECAETAEKYWIKDGTIIVALTKHNLQKLTRLTFFPQTPGLRKVFNAYIKIEPLHFEVLNATYTNGILKISLKTKPNTLAYINSTKIQFDKHGQAIASFNASLGKVYLYVESAAAIGNKEQTLYAWKSNSPIFKDKINFQRKIEFIEENEQPYAKITLKSDSRQTWLLNLLVNVTLNEQKINKRISLPPQAEKTIKIPVNNIAVKLTAQYCSGDTCMTETKNALIIVLPYLNYVWLIGIPLLILLLKNGKKQTKRGKYSS